MIWDVNISKLEGSDLAKEITATYYKRGLVIERAGCNDNVIKLMPALTIEKEDAKYLKSLLLR